MNAWGGSAATSGWNDDCEEVGARATGELRSSGGAEMLHLHELSRSEMELLSLDPCV
ncbi:hypothetical protein QM565_39050 [Geitlerinema splendidum]|nr:hypothetical protein [Geitlerinema splendidum]